MKFLEIPQLELLASMLSNSSTSVRVTTRIEAYSCKSVASERKMMKSLDHEFATDLEVSGSSSSIDGLPSTSLESAFGRLDRKECRKTFWLLIATLNAAYPDHNFSRIKAEDFKSEPPRTVLTKLSEALELDRSGSDFASTLGALSTSPECISRNSSENFHKSNLAHSLLAGVHPLIGQVLDPIIDLAHCQVYSYSPDPDSDPHAVVSDDEEHVESVSSSIYGSGKHAIIQESPIHPHEETMWEIEDVDGPLYVYSDDPATLPPGSYNLPTQTISTPSSPPSHARTRPTFSQRAEKFARLYAPPESSPLNSPIDPECQASSLCALSSSHGTNDEEESAGGLLWSSHYFFYNRKQKRILFISIWGRKALMSSAVDESWIRHTVDYSSNCCDNISPTMFRHAGLGESSVCITKPNDNSTTIAGLSTYQSGVNERSSGLKRHLTSNLSKRLDLPYEPKSFVRTVDPLEASESTSSMAVVSRPFKKKRSQRNPL